jgi:hypothetical protein
MESTQECCEIGRRDNENAEIRDGCFWKREYSDDGYQKIVKYRIE